MDSGLAPGAAPLITGISTGGAGAGWYTHNEGGGLVQDDQVSLPLQDVAPLPQAGLEAFGSWQQLAVGSLKPLPTRGSWVGHVMRVRAAGHDSSAQQLCAWQQGAVARLHLDQQSV